jgi:archaellum biogenesis ATPase FlaH
MGMDVAEEMFYRQDQIDDRVKTGLEGLDSLIQGGFPKRSINLVSGPPGSGKSILCFQFLYEGLIIPSTFLSKVR